MKTGLITSETFQDHDTGPGHPEQIARVTVINENLKKLNNKNILWKKPSIITDDIIKDTHDKNYVDFVKNSFPTKGYSSLDGDTIISPGSSELSPCVLTSTFFSICLSITSMCLSLIITPWSL